MDALQDSCKKSYKGYLWKSFILYIAYVHNIYNICPWLYIYTCLSISSLCSKKKKKKMKSHFTCLKRTTKRHLLIWEFFSTIIFFKLDIIIYFMYLSSQIEHKHASSPHIISQKWHLLLNTFRTIKKWFPNWDFTWWFAKIFAKIITWVCHHWLAVVPSSELATAVFL